ncbi:MAG: polyprenyl synthetase family protein [bacterium]|nr:polyprenyl synthetase family protein [Candidatus Sumerlaeota bacterium]
MNTTNTDTNGLIEHLSEYLLPELTEVDRHILGILNSDTELVREACQYVISSGGKHLRPILTILASRACGYEGCEHTKVAASIELIHTATLLHDDVIDKAALRRRRATVNAKWGDDVAILIADYLYSNAFNLALNSLTPSALALLCRVTAGMCEGEIYQIEKKDALITEKEYLRIIRNKTACLFSACSGLGSIIAKATEQETVSFSLYGLNFGIAFQITDDTLDLVAEDAETGKQHWADIRNGKQTLPLIRAFEVASPHDRADLWDCWTNGRDSERIMKHIRNYNGIEYSLEQARRYAADSKRQLDRLAKSRDIDLLCQLTDYVVKRRS